MKGNIIIRRILTIAVRTVPPGNSAYGPQKRYLAYGLLIFPFVSEIRPLRPSMLHPGLNILVGVSEICQASGGCNVAYLYPILLPADRFEECMFWGCAVEQEKKTGIKNRSSVLMASRSPLIRFTATKSHQESSGFNWTLLGCTSILVSTSLRSAGEFPNGARRHRRGEINVYRLAGDSRFEGARGCVSQFAFHSLIRLRCTVAESFALTLEWRSIYFLYKPYVR